MTDVRSELIHQIAAELDKPSIYMGGPSPRSRRMAQQIVDLLPDYEAEVERLRDREAQADHLLRRAFDCRHPEDVPADVLLWLNPEVMADSPPSSIAAHPNGVRDGYRPARPVCGHRHERNLIMVVSEAMVDRALPVFKNHCHEQPGSDKYGPVRPEKWDAYDRDAVRAILEAALTEDERDRGLVRLGLEGEEKS